jgi:hypothetical protein
VRPEHAYDYDRFRRRLRRAFRFRFTGLLTYPSGRIYAFTMTNTGLPSIRRAVLLGPKELATISVFPEFETLGGFINGTAAMSILFLILVFIFLFSFSVIC